MLGRVAVRASPLLSYSSVILSENRFPLFGIML
jgi:hypothetical protein